VVKVWGALYPTGLTGAGSAPEILVDSIISDVVAPTATPTATATPSPPAATVINPVVNVRSGPGTDYPVVGNVNQGTTCPITGRNNNSTWWQVRCPNGVNGWVYYEIVMTSGNIAGVPVVNVAPPPQPATPTPTPLPPIPVSAWRASIYTNRNLSGAPVRVVNWPQINFNWGTGSPASYIPTDNFSIRFESTMPFAGGNYELRLTIDDGARVWLDNQLIIDEWREGSARTITVNRFLSGNHYIRIDYFEATGNAQVVFTANLVSSSVVWQAAYFNNDQLSGSPVLVRGEPRGGKAPLDQNWGQGSPAAGVVPVDHWSARFEGTFYFEAGDYTFLAGSDDGVRLYLDGIKILDNWSPGYHEVTNNFFGLSAGNHRVTVEYFDNDWTALVSANWWRINTTGGGSGSGGRPRDE
jgi:hypothetical protein